MAKKDSGGVDRRAFLGGIGAAGAAAAAVAGVKPTPAEAKPTALPPVSQSHATTIAQLEQAPPIDHGPGADAQHITNPGSDYMVDVLMALGYKYVAATPGTTFRGLQESVINYAQGKMEWLSCAHEEISGSMAHGYAKAAGKPMIIMVHNTVGLQHASMALYNCWADRVPMLVMLGNYADGALRSSAADWDHAMLDNAAMVRGYIKYDEQPGSLQHYKESMLRGHGLMMTAPSGPIVMVCDQTLQEDTASRKPQPPMPAYVAATQPAPDPSAIKQIAQMLVTAKNPVIVADRATRSQADVLNLVKLAETLQVPVIDKLGRMNFPTNHYLNGAGGLTGEADLILALDPGDLSSYVERLPESIARNTIRTARPDCKVISIDSELLASAGNFQDKQRFYQADFPVAADAATTLPFLIEAVNSAMPTGRRNENAQREQRLREAFFTKREADMAVRRGRLGFSADQRRTHVHGDLEPDQGRPVVGRFTNGLPEQLARASLGLHQLQSIPRRIGCRGHRLHRRRGDRLRARAQRYGSSRVRQLPGRRRLHDGSRRDVDRRPSPDSAADGHPQQSRVVPRNDVGADPCIAA